jgi:hypothetical protein
MLTVLQRCRTSPRVALRKWVERLVAPGNWKEKEYCSYLQQRPALMRLHECHGTARPHGAPVVE